MFRLTYSHDLIWGINIYYMRFKHIFGHFSNSSKTIENRSKRLRVNNSQVVNLKIQGRPMAKCIETKNVNMKNKFPNKGMYSCRDIPIEITLGNKFKIHFRDFRSILCHYKMIHLSIFNIF